MPNINKLLSKVNQASQAIKSAKGIKAQISSAGYKGGVNTEEVDKLQEQSEENRRKLEERRGNLQKQLSSKNVAKKGARTPPAGFIDMQYPIEADFDNFLVFETRPRKERKGGNLLSEKRLSIALPLPQGGWSQDAEAKWGENEGIGAFARGALGGKNVGGMIEETLNAVKGFISDKMGSMGGGIGNLRAGQAKNPMKEQAFEGVEFRDHSFEWEFYPRSPEEALMCQKIINGFKIALLPDTFASYEGADLEWGESEHSPSENFFNFPNIFDVYIEGPIAKQMERFLPMVCTGVSVDEMVNDEYIIAMNDDMQWSGSKSLSVSFVEIKLMTQESYASRVAPEILPQSEYGNMTNTTGSASLMDGEEVATFTVKEKKPPTPKT